MGGMSMTVRADGIIEVSRGAPYPLPRKKRVALLSAEQLHEIADFMRDEDCCDLRSRRSKPHSDESRLTFDIRLEDLDCQVTLLDGERDDIPHAKACYGYLDSLANNTLPRW